VRASEILNLRHGPRPNAVITRPSESRGGLLAWQLNRVIDYIDMHLAEKVTANALADLINVSTGYLFRAFKISAGSTPFRYIARRRVVLACTIMMTTRDPLCQIAIACGVCDQAHLCKMFRREFGMSPTDWRREQRRSCAERNVPESRTSDRILDCQRL
jgi:AraC family transcriptional regulator